MVFNKLMSPMDHGVALYQNGRYAEAEAAFNTYLKVNPNNINALHLLALSVFQQRRLPDAERILRSAVKKNKKISKLHHSLGQVQEAQGKLDNALSSLTTASKLDPNNEWIHINKAIVLGKLKRTSEAISSARYVLKINHNNVTAKATLGQLLWQQGDNIAAKKALNEALELQPNFVQALSHLGTILFSEGNLDAAEEYLRKAENIGPPHPEVLCNLTGVLLAKEDHHALDYSLKAVKLSPKYPNAYLYLGRALEQVGQWDEAFTAYSKALQLQPNSKLASIGLAGAEMNLGQFDKAKELCWKELGRNPHFLEAYSILLELEDPENIRDKLEFIEQLYNKSEYSDKEKWRTAFSLAHFYEKDAQYKKSFDILMDANRLKRSIYDDFLEDERCFFNNIQSVFTKDFINKRVDYGLSDKTPIFILGMPRSGTTLTEQILASHSQVFGSGELQYISNSLRNLTNSLLYIDYPEAVKSLNPSEYTKIASWYLDKIRDKDTDALKITDKLPHNFLNLGIIRILFPHAKVIHCKRNPIDNCLSIYKQNFTDKHKYAYDLAELGHYYLLYRDLMDHWRSVLPNEYILEVEYEDIVADQEGMTRRLLEFCDLPWEEGCLQFHKTKRAILTASQKQVRRKIYSDSIKLWQHYEKQLQPLIEVLQSGNAL